MVHTKKIEQFTKLVVEDREAALRDLADAVFDSHDTEDFKALWRDINSRVLPWEPFHTMTDEQIVETMIDTKDWRGAWTAAYGDDEEIT